MRHFTIALALALTTVAISAVAVYADGGPHGGYDKTTTGAAGITDACAGCHRPHSGQSVGFLLKRPTQYELCVTCHNGEGSRLDVLDGVKLAATQPRVPGQTVAGGTLNGGGFEYVNGTLITSKHNVKTSQADPGESQPWGYLADTGTKSGTLAQPLTCTSCHNPHGSANYRIFRETVNSRTVSVLAYYSGSFTKQEGARGLETGVPADKYTSEYYGSNALASSGGYQPTGSIAANPGDPAVNGFALLCGACHSSYPSSDAKSLPAPNPWSISKYRHRTEMPYTDWTSPKYSGVVPCQPETNPFNPGPGDCSTTGGTRLPALRLASNASFTNEIVTCVTCHRAHGTATLMVGFALESSLGGTSPDQVSPAQTATSTSMLLFTDNRGMCEACHQW